MQSPSIHGTPNIEASTDKDELQALQAPVHLDLSTSYATEVFTGIRPTGDLTIANYLGAIEPVLNLQARGMRPLVFVADLHAYTDHEPRIAAQNTRDIIATFLAAGLNPSTCDIFVQSELASEVYMMTSLLTRHLTVSELMRVPTIKDKIDDATNPQSINLMLALYPVMMSADILLQRARYVPTGQDQLAHLEMTRKLAKRFNDQYEAALIAPEALEIEQLRIRSLDGSGKMSKSRPAGAIFLTDQPDQVRNKIKQAKTGFAGEMTEDLKSHLITARTLAQNEQVRAQIDEIMADHMSGKAVMGSFKQVFSEVVNEFLAALRLRRSEVDLSPDLIDAVLIDGRSLAKRNAHDTLQKVHDALGVRFPLE